MRLRDLFRGPSNNERKLTTTILPIIDVSTFINAALEKDTDNLQKYLLAGFPPDQSDPITQATALHVAVESGNTRAIQALLQAGAQVNLCDSSVSTPLHIAAYMGYEEIVQILLAHGADIFKQDNTGRNPFHLAVSTGNNRLIQHFLSNIDPEQNIIHIPDVHYWTPLMCACASSHQLTCALLLSRGADLCAVNDRGMNVLHIAAFLGSISVLDELLNRNFDDQILFKALNQGDNRNQTPLFHACLEGHLNIVLTLLHAGANAYHLDNENQTCLHAMLSSGILFKRHIRLFYRLIEFVDYRSYQDYLSRTLLDLAYLNQLNTIISLLTMLNYKRNYSIISNNDSPAISIRSLRQWCIVNFKRSIIYHQNQKQLTQHELLETALRQCFHIHLNRDFDLNELPYRKSLDDVSVSMKKTPKSNKKSRKTSNIFSLIPADNEPQHTQSSWSIFTNKFKPQRTSGSPQEPISPSGNSPPLSNECHPMKSLALPLLFSPRKLDDLLDFPSLNTNPFLEDDLRTVMNVYNLEGTDSSNQI